MTGDVRLFAAITAGGRRSMLKLAQRMTANFCAGVCASTVHKWNKLNAGSVDEDVRVMTRKSVDDPGEPPGIVLSAATSVWLPVSPQRLFDFLRDERLRSEWDILSNGGPMQEMAHIAKGQDHGNCVSLLRASVFFLSLYKLFSFFFILLIFSLYLKFFFSFYFCFQMMPFSITHVGLSGRCIFCGDDFGNWKYP